MLIKTKIKAPSLRSHMLFRKDLVNRLRAVKGYPLIVLSGPAGSGKTSLACQWLYKERLRAAWYSLEPEDNEPDIFFRYLLAAFIRSEKRLNAPLGPMLGNPQQLTGDLVIPLLIEALSEINLKSHLVLDDFHHIENEEILKALARFIQYSPDDLQQVILSRHRLPDVVNTVALKKERLEISASDLKFTETETVDLYKNVLPLSADQIRELNRHMEGWAAGLQLIGLEIRSKGHSFNLSSIYNQAHEQVASYLIHDLLSNQPKNVRNFVFTTALLDRFNPELCAEVTSLTESTGILAHLNRMNLFLIPLDPRKKWYRYHHMFSEVVRYRAAIDDPALIPVTLRKAAKWFAENGHIEDALRSAFRTGDFEFAADLMEDHIHPYMEQFGPVQGLQWILRLPTDLLNQRTLLRLHQCNFLMILMEPSKIKNVLAAIERDLNQALERYSGDKRTLCEDFIIYLKCMLTLFHEIQAKDFLKLDTLRKKISARNEFLSRAVGTTLAFVMISKGDLYGAEKFLSKLFRRIAPFEEVIQKIYFDKAKALIAGHRGQLHQAEAIIGQVRQDLTSRGLSNIPMAFILHRHLGYIYYLQNRLTEAQECATLALRYCEYSGLVDQIMAGNELRLLLHLAADEKARAAECLKQLRSYAVKIDEPQFADSIDGLAARIAIDHGNLGPAIFWSQRRNLTAEEPFSLLFAMQSQIQARLYYAQGKYAEALELLKILRVRCLKRDLHELVLHIDILRSAALHALKHNEAAKSLLSEALAFSETQGYVRPFVNDAARISPILSSIAKELPDGSYSSFFKDLLNACHIPIHRSIFPGESKNPEYDDLTKREVQILEWVAQGAKNQEIAQKAFISVGTVKTHVHRIIAKLNVQNRTQAIIKARELDII